MNRTQKAAAVAYGQGLTAITVLVVFGLLSRKLSHADYTTFRQTFLTYQVASPFLMLGLPMGLYYFLPQSPPDTWRAKIIENLSLLLAMGLLFTGCIVLGVGGWLAQYFNNPFLSASLNSFCLYPAFTFPAMALTACLVTRGCVKELAIFQTISKGVVLVIIIVFVNIWPTSRSAITGMVLAAAVVLFPAVLMMVVNQPGQWTFSISSALNQLCYCVPLGFANLFGQLNAHIGTIFVAGAVSAEDFSLYINGAIEVPLIGIITGSVTSILLPDLAKYFSENSNEKAIDLWKAASVKVGCFLLPLTAYLWLIATDLMIVIYSDIYAESAFYFQALLLLMPIRIVAFGSIFQASGNGKAIMIRAAISLIINCTLAYFLVKRYGAIGGIVSAIVTVYCYTVPFNLWKISKITSVSITSLLPYTDIAKIVALSVLAAIPFVFINIDSWPILVRMLMTLAIYVILLFVLVKVLAIRVMERVYADAGLSFLVLLKSLVPSVFNDWRNR